MPKRHPKDKEWKPNQSVRKKTPKQSQGGLMAMRANSHSVVKKDDGQYTPRRRAVRVRDGSDIFTPDSKATFQSSLGDHLQDHLGGYRSHVVDESELGLGTPQGVKTPGGTQLRLDRKIGPLAFYSNDSQEDASESSQNERNSVQLDPAFYASTQYAAIKNIQENAKHKVAFITKKSLSRTQSSYKASGYKRIRSQNQEMASSSSQSRTASATDYAEAAQLYSGKVRWEWLHLVAYAIQGPESQDVGNLVAGTQHANTDMMFVEGIIPYLASQYPDGFTLEIDADLLPDTHIATKITYVIKTDEFTLAFDFDPQVETKPHKDIGEVLKLFIPQFVDAKRSAASVSSSSSTLFSGKRRDEDEVDLSQSSLPNPKLKS